MPPPRHTRRRPPLQPSSANETVLFAVQPPFYAGHPKSRRARHTYTNLRPTSTRKRSRPSGASSSTRLCEYLRTLDVAPKARIRLHYFVHVPKTGGAALKLALLNSPAAVPSCSTVQSVLLRARGHNEYVRVVSVGHNGVQAIDPRVPTFCVLRDPYERMRSAFRYVMEGGKHAAVWEMPQKHTMEAWKRAGIRSVADLLDTAARRKTTMAHVHFRPMTEFVTDANGALAVDKVFFQDALDAQVVGNYLGIAPFEMPIKNQSERPYTLTAADRACIATHYAEDVALYKAARAAHGGGVPSGGVPSGGHSRRRRRSHAAPFWWTPPPPPIQRTLYLKPPHVTHFWHFMMGEFLPVVAAYCACRPRPRVVHVYKTDVASPFNAFYEELNEGDDRRFVVSATHHAPVGTYHRLPANRNGWDWRHRPRDVAPLLKAVRFLRTWALGATQAPSAAPTVCVQLRTNTKALTQYYADLDTNLVRRKKYGAERRCVTNLPAVVDALRAAGKVTVRAVTDDGLTLREQIRQYADAQVLVLGHGAGMVHALWMRAPVTIVELINQQKVGVMDGAVQGCRRLVKLLSTKRHPAKLRRIVVEDTHADVDVKAVVTKVHAAMETKGRRP